MWCILTSDDAEPENYKLSDNQIADLCHCGHNNKTTKKDRKLQIFPTEGRLLNISDQLFEPQMNWFISSNATLSYESIHFSTFRVLVQLHHGRL